MISLLALACLVFDQLLKVYLVSTHSPLVSINHAQAFGLNIPAVLTVGYLLVISFWILDIKRTWNFWLILALAALSNMTDRQWAYGVIDYIPIGQLRFNIADIIILLTISYLIWQTLKKHKSYKRGYILRGPR